MTLWLLAVLGLGAIVLTFVSLAAGGIGVDTKLDTETAQTIRNIPPDTSLSEAYETVYFTSEFYGTFVQQAADVLFTLRGGATETGSVGGLQPIDAWTYRYQGLVVVLMALIAVTTMAVALSIALKSRLVGAFFWALTLSTPLWLGMSHVDFKDMPVAAGLTMVSAGLILSQVRRPEGSFLPASILIGAVGGAMSLSTRPGSVVLVVGLAFGVLVIALIHGWLVKHSPRPALPVAAVAATSPAVGLAFTLLTNPVARIDPLTWMVDAVDTVRDYPIEVLVRVAGRYVSSLDIPLWYVPAWLLAQLPLLTLVSLVAALLFLVWQLIRNPGLLLSPLTPALSPLVIQAVVLPALIVLSGAVIYDAIRHLLFMIPGLLALISVAFSAVVRERTSPRWMHWAPIASVVVVAFSLFASARWTPYSYAFINPFAGLWKGAWDLDYWGVSSREGVTRLKELGYEKVRVSLSSETGLPWGAVKPEGPIISSSPTGAYVFIRWYLRADYLKCRVLFEIKRDGQLLGEGAECPSVPKSEAPKKEDRKGSS